MNEHIDHLMEVNKLKKIIFLLSVLSALTLPTANTQAHVPYFERGDFTDEHPFNVPKEIEQSIAVYAWLHWQLNGSTTDIDVYRFELYEPANAYLEILVPVCDSYADYAPWFALVGPGLPPPSQELPFTIPEGQGVLLGENTAPGEPRDSFYEPFGAKSYYEGPIVETLLTEPGSYTLYVWDPESLGGDYVAVIGNQEIWEKDDILRAILLTPMIRQDRELHTLCPDTSPRH